MIIQLANICTLRFQDKGKEFGVPEANYIDFSTAEIRLMEQKVKAMPLSTKLRFLDHIVTNQISGEAWAGKTWRGLCAEVLRAAKATSHQQRVIAVDRLMNLLHHGGSITDYLDGSRWLPEALNYRDNASFLQLARRASGEVKKAIRMSSFIGADRTDVPVLKMLETAVLRCNSSRPMWSGIPWTTMKTSVVGNKIFIRLNDDDSVMLVGTHKNDEIHFKDQNGLEVPSLFSRRMLHPASVEPERSSIKLPITNYHNLVKDIQLWLHNYKSRKTRELG